MVKINDRALTIPLIQGYWVYRLFKINYNQLSYCVEEDVCQSSEIKNIYSTNALQWAGERTG